MSTKTKIESITQLTFSGSTTPTENQLNDFIIDGANDIIRKSIANGGEILDAFSTTTSVTNGSGVQTNGNIILSVTRGDGAIQNPANLVPTSLKGRVTDTDSLYFASKFNPVYYVENGKVFIEPAPTGTTDENGNVTFVDTVSSASLTGFPSSHLNLVYLYAGAMAYFAKASNIELNLSSVPTFAASPGFSYNDVELPTIPTFTPPAIEFDLTDINTALSNDDLDLADSRRDILDKKIERFDKDLGKEKDKFNTEMDVFNKRLEILLNNANKNIETVIAQFGSDVRKYEMDIQEYQNKLEKDRQSYKWYIERYISLLNQYNSSITALFSGRTRQQAQQTEGGE